MFCDTIFPDENKERKDMRKKAYNKKRHFIQWCLAPVVIITIIFGWKYPLLGFSVPMVLLMGIIGGAIRGRYVCGNLCPRGSFYDRIVSKISGKKNTPSWMKSMAFRLPVLAALMGMMMYRIITNTDGIAGLGRIFWMMCVVTTAIGVILAFFIHKRSWCTFCPMGTMQNILGRAREALKIDKDLCVGCGFCEKACPMNIKILSYKESGEMSDKDCLKCSECVTVCPKKALSWPSKK
jgi:ferredoxin-type protein NapH